MYAAVDCRNPEGTVLLFEPNGIGDAWHNAWYVDADSLTTWLETWLSKMGWYEEDADEQDEAQKPRPWEMAQQRLSEPE